MRYPLSLVFGVALPLITLAIELATGFSAEIFINPIPTWWHVALVAFVPIANLWVLLKLSRSGSAPIAIMLMANGIAFSIAAFYGIFFAPISPFAVLGIAAYGLGMLPLSPLLSGLVTIRLGLLTHRLAREQEWGSWQSRVSTTIGAIGAGVILLAMGDVPYVATRIAMGAAASEDPVRQAHGLGQLRRWGSRSEMLRECLDFDHDVRPSTWWFPRLTSADAQRVFFRVTGERWDQRYRPWLMRDQDFGWRFGDDALGGTEVAGKRKGLYWDGSQLNVDIDPEHAVTYSEWTLEFRNDTSQAEEARALIHLPSGGVVTRLTLWVNGQPREAAFAPKPQVRAAYEKVAVVQRCDPVLVTWKGPDRILMQCFPVPAHGRMKLRIGMTSPWTCSADGLLLGTPRVIEENFQTERELQHEWSIASGGQTLEFRERNGSVLSQHAAQEGPLLATWNAEQANHVELFIPHVTPSESWTLTEVAPCKQLCVVLDGSKHVRESLSRVASALARLRQSGDFELLVASDELADLSDQLPQPSDDLSSDVERLLAKRLTRGGTDNVPALREACRRSRFAEQTAIVWIHGPQPVELSAADLFWRDLEALPASNRVYSIQLGRGSNRLLEDFAANRIQQWVLETKDIAHGLDVALEQIVSATTAVAYEFGEPPETNASVANSHFDELTAWAIVQDWLRAGFEANRERAAEFASRNHLVTPVTGAVVLETDEQYAESGLTPVDAGQKPPVITPEPSSATLMLMACLGFWSYARSIRHRKKG